MSAIQNERHAIVQVIAFKLLFMRINSNKLATAVIESVSKLTLIIYIKHPIADAIEYMYMKNFFCNYFSLKVIPNYTIIMHIPSLYNTSQRMQCCDIPIYYNFKWLLQPLLIFNRCSSKFRSVAALTTLFPDPISVYLFSLHINHQTQIRFVEI